MKRRTETRVCQQCGIAFEARTDTKGLFCSYQCLGKSRKGINNKVERQCIVCRQTFKIQPSELKKGPTRGLYCSKSCRALENKMTKRELHEHRDIMSYRPQARKQLRAMWLVKGAKEIHALAPQPCEVCGSVERVHAHHKDYSKPLEVTWLCPFHHKQAHKVI